MEGKEAHHISHIHKSYIPVNNDSYKNIITYYLVKSEFSASSFNASSLSFKTWKLLSLKPGFWARHRTSAWVGMSARSRVFMVWRGK